MFNCMQKYIEIMLIFLLALRIIEAVNGGDAD